MVTHTCNSNVWESHTFSTSTREVETGAILLERERNIKGESKELPEVWSLRFCGDLVQSIQFEDRPFSLSIGRGKGLSSDLVLCFSDLQASFIY